MPVEALPLAVSRRGEQSGPAAAFRASTRDPGADATRSSAGVDADRSARPDSGIPDPSADVLAQVRSGWRIEGLGDYARRMTVPAIPSLSSSQLSTLAGAGEELTAGVGDELYRVGDHIYPFIAIREGEVAILDAAGNEIVRHGAGSFLGELNLLSGQTVFVTALVTETLRYIAVDREALRALLFKNGPLSDLVLSTFIARREALQRVQGIGRASCRERVCSVV